MNKEASSVKRIVMTKPSLPGHMPPRLRRQVLEPGQEPEEKVEPGQMPPEGPVVKEETPTVKSDPSEEKKTTSAKPTSPAAPKGK